MQKLSLNHDERGEVGDTGETPSETHLFKKLPQTTDRPLSSLTLHSTLYAPHSTLHTFHPTLHTLHPTLQNPHFTLYTLHSPLNTPLSLHSTLCTPPPSTFHSLQCAGMVAGEKWKNVQDCSNNLFHTSFLRDCIQVRCFFAKIQSAGARSPQNTAVIPAMFFAGATYKGAVQAKDVADDAN